ADAALHIQLDARTRRPDAEIARRIKPDLLHSTGEESHRIIGQRPEDHRPRPTDKAGTRRTLITKSSSLDSTFKESELDERACITQLLSNCLGAAEDMQGSRGISNANPYIAVQFCDS